MIKIIKSSINLPSFKSIIQKTPFLLKINIIDHKKKFLIIVKINYCLYLKIAGLFEIHFFPNFIGLES